jgi:hypothetical protein
MRSAAPAPKPRRHKRWLIGTVTGVVLATTAGTIYVASQQVADQSMIQCLYSQDLNEDAGTMLAMSGSEELPDPVAWCAEQWREGVLSPSGRNPAFDDPRSGFNPDDGTHNHAVPELTACVHDGMVAVIPGPESVCASLGLPKLER